MTTVDMDFLFRKTPANVRKLKAITRDLEAVLFRPYYPVIDFFRVEREVDRLQLDFMTAMDGIATFEGLGKRADRVPFGKAILLVASLADIIKSKKAAGRPQDLAVMYVLEAALARKEKENHEKSAAESSQGGK